MGGELTEIGKSEGWSENAIICMGEYYKKIF